MCFSAHASFGAALVLGAIGVVAVRAAKRKAREADAPHAFLAVLPLATVPILFAAQQATEGWLWLVLSSAPWGKSDSPLGRVFLFFALAVWPAYIPFALACVERSRARRRVLRALTTVGAALGVYLLGCATLRLSDTCIAFGSLYYWIQIDSPFKAASPFVYAALIIGGMLLSSRRGTSLLALATVVSFVVSGLFHRAGFLSIWCFFAACLSGITVLVVRAASVYPRRPSACVRAAMSSFSS